MKAFMVKEANKMRGDIGRLGWDALGGGRPQSAIDGSQPWVDFMKATQDKMASIMIEVTKKEQVADINETELGVIFVTNVGPLGATVDLLLAANQDLVAAMPLMIEALGENSTETSNYLKTKMRDDAGQSWSDYLELGTKLIVHDHAQLARDGEGRAWLIIGNSEARKNIMKIEINGEVHDATKAMERKLPCIGGKEVVEIMKQSEMILIVARYMREAAEKPKTVASLNDSPDKKLLRGRILTHLQALNASAKLEDMAEHAATMSELDVKQFVLQKIWPAIRNVVTSAYVLETCRGDELDWGEDNTNVLTFMGRRGMEQAALRFDLGKVQAAPGATIQEALACAYLFAVRNSAKETESKGLLGTDLTKDATDEAELFRNTEHVVEVSKNLEEKLRGMLEPYEDTQQTKAFEAKVGMKPQALLAITIQLRNRAEGCVEIKTRIAQRGGKASNKAERRKQLGNVLKLTRTTLGMGAYTMPPEADKVEQRFLRELKRDLEAQRHSDALVLALDRSTQALSGGGGGDEASKKRQKTKQHSIAEAAKSCMNCGVKGHRWKICETRSLLASGRRLSFRQLNYVNSIPDFDLKIQHESIPDKENP